MKSSAIFVLILMVSMASSGVAASSATPESRFAYYQDNISILPAGVYEHGDDLYVHAKVKIKKLDTLPVEKKNAVFAAMDLLRGWGAGQIKAHGGSDVSSKGLGVRAVENCLDEFNPQWRLAEWNYRFNGQEFALGRKNGYYVLGQVMAKDDVLKSLRDFQSQMAMSPQNAFKWLRNLLPRALAVDATRTYRLCGAVDLLPSASVLPKNVKDEVARVNAEVAGYLSTGSYPALLRKRAESVRGPCMLENWIERAGEPEVISSDTTVMLTNRMENVDVVTNVIVRLETAEEKLARGVAEGGKFRQETQSADEEEVIETRTVTTVTKTRRIRRRVHVETMGVPRFEDLFLAAGVITNAASAQLESGRKAAADYLRGGVDMSTLEHRLEAALCENPGDVQMWNMYGNCLNKKGDVIGALICFRCAVGVNAHDQFALTNLCRVYDTLGCQMLSYGYAILVRGVSNDAWCLKKVDEILLKK